MAEDQSHYKRLGVERSADLKTIKRAYFEKVRQFPPETHPEEFRAIREAYEVLSDEGARKQYDAQDDSDGEFGPDAAAQMRAARALAEAGNMTGARSALVNLLADHPEMHPARDLLGLWLLSAKEPQTAFEHFERIVAEQPQNADYWVHLGHAQSVLEKKAEAEASYRKAKELNPLGVSPRAALMDFFAETSRWQDVVKEVEEAISQTRPEAVGELHLRKRAIHAYLSMKNFKAIWPEVEKIEQRVRAEKDPELLVYTATQVGAISARLFAEERFDLANQLLRRCRTLNPSSLVEVPYPARVPLRIDELPAASQAIIEEESKRTKESKLGVWGWPVVGYAVASGLAAALAVSTWLPSSGESSLFWPGLGVLLLSLGAAAAGRRLLRIARAKYSTFSFLRTLHYVQVYLDEVTAYPILNLHNVGLVKHHTNGVYTHTALNVHFDGVRKSFTYRDESAARSMAEAFLSRRQRALQLLDQGLLDAEEDIGFIPPPLLEKSFKQQRKIMPEWRGWGPWIGGAVGVTAGLMGVSMALAPGNRDDRSWGKASSGTPQVVAQYIADNPNGRRVAAAQAKLDAAFDEALATLDRRRDSAHADAGLPALLKAMKAAHLVNMQVRVVNDPDSARGPNDEALPPAWLHGRDQLIELGVASALQAVLSDAGVSEVLLLGAAPGAHATLEVHQQFGTSTEPPLQAGTASLPRLKGSWTVTASVAGKPVPEVQLHVEALTPESVLVRIHDKAAEGARPKVPSDAAYGAMEDAVVEGLVDAWMGAWGLRKPLAIGRPVSLAAGGANGR